MKKRFVISFITIITVIIFILFLRFFLGGDEDTWICQNGAWVKHGNPSNTPPAEECGVKTKIVEEIKEEFGDISTCISPSGISMNFEQAEEIAERDCLEGILEKNHFCNDSTGTWWIDFTPNQLKEGCNPACVVDVENGKAEINWRCTGLIEGSM